MFLLQDDVILSYFVSSVEGIYIVEYSSIMYEERGVGICKRKPLRSVARVMLEKYTLLTACVNDSSDTVINIIIIMIII
jgi:hypothetical protein